MFSGLTNQISGWVANKTGGAADPNADPNAAAAGAAPVDPNDPNAQYQQVWSLTSFEVSCQLLRKLESSPTNLKRLQTSMKPNEIN